MAVMSEMFGRTYEDKLKDLWKPVGNLAQCSTDFERRLPLRRTLSQIF
jgi:hypothetical protein